MGNRESGTGIGNRGHPGFFLTISLRFPRAEGRVASGVTPRGSHRSGLARLRHTARQITDSLRTVTPTRTATAA